MKFTVETKKEKPTFYYAAQAPFQPAQCQISKNGYQTQLCFKHFSVEFIYKNSIFIHV